MVCGAVDDGRWAMGDIDVGVVVWGARREGRVRRRWGVNSNGNGNGIAKSTVALQKTKLYARHFFGQAQKTASSNGQ